MCMKLSPEDLKSGTCPLPPTRIYSRGVTIILKVRGCLFILLIKGNCKISHVYEFFFFLIRFCIILFFLMTILKIIPKVATRNNNYLAMTTLPI